MPTGHRSRSRSSYRGRRSAFPFFLLLIGVALAAFLVFSILDPSASEDPQTGSPSPSPSASAPAEPPAETPPAAQDQPSEAPSAEPALPPLSKAPWYLTLANADHPLQEDWDVETTALSNGLRVDSRIYEALTAMLNDCKAEGLSPIVCSAYRTIKRQTELFEQKLNKYMRDGLSYDEAYAAASTIVTVPGTSEHNLGLAVDICALDYQLLNDAQADTEEQKWLMEHCVEYGFILRYPQDKEEITGIIWEPWHYRYVGVEIAREITESGLCLEEYLALHYSGVY